MICAQCVFVSSTEYSVSDLGCGMAAFDIFAEGVAVVLPKRHIFAVVEVDAAAGISRNVCEVDYVGAVYAHEAARRKRRLHILQTEEGGYCGARRQMQAYILPFALEVYDVGMFDDRDLVVGLDRDAVAGIVLRS